MKKLIYLRWFVLLAALVWMGASYSPGSYPLTYQSVETNAGVVSWEPSLLVGCEIANGSASAQSYMFYDANSIPADGFNTACSNAATPVTPCMVGFVYKCPSKATCFWNPAGPSLVQQGGVGKPTKLGIVWSNSTTFPAKTIGAMDSVVSCSYHLYSMGPPAPVSTPTATPFPASTPTSTPFPM